MTITKMVAAAAVATGLLLGLVGCKSESDTGGSGGEAGSGGGTPGAGGSGGGDATPTCEAYCSTVMANCTGDNADYVSADVCMAVCETMPIGTAADTTGNTVGCRTYHSGAAKAGPAEHCPHAGPGGAGFCGDNCEGYCSLMLSACSGVYNGTTECMTACKGLTDTEPFSANTKTGDTLQCRLYHASVATLDDVHCVHANVMSTPEFCGAPE